MGDSSSFPPPRAAAPNHESPNLWSSLPPTPPGRPYTLGFSTAEVSCGNSKRNASTPPFHPHVLSPSQASQFSGSTMPQPPRTSPGHLRSLSQPAGFFSLDALPLEAERHRGAGNVVMEEDSSGAGGELLAATSLVRSNSGRMGDGLPPRKAHRRSHSDITFGFADSFAQLLGSVPSLPPRPQQVPQGQFMKQEWDWDVDSGKGGDGLRGGKDGSDCADDLIDAYMNLDSLDVLDSSEEKWEDMDSRASGTKTTDANSSENESESSVNENASSSQILRKRSPSATVEKMEMGKGFMVGGSGGAGPPRHNRSVSMDSFMGKIDFCEDLMKLPPSPGLQACPLSRNNSLDVSQSNFNIELANGRFSGSEMNKIMANPKLAEIAVNDPKRAKRILANRQSAARSKERKTRYMSELEVKVQTLQNEATTLSAQLTILQQDSAGLTNHNNELKFRLQAMEQQAQLRDALHEALTTEVQRLRFATAGLSDTRSFMSPQLPLNVQTYQLHQQLLQSSQLPVFQSQPTQSLQEQQHLQNQQQLNPHILKDNPS